LDPKTIGYEKKYQNRVISTDLVVHGAGRVANIEGLNLEKGNVESSSKGILVNDFLQSVTNPDVYAAGDVVANISPNVTPKAEYDGKLVSTNLLSGNMVKATYDEIPRVVFTIPALASVGKNEMELNKGGFNYRVNYQDTSKWYTSRRDGETCSGFKVLIDNETEKILGAHLIGPHAEEVINIFSLAIKLGLTTSELRNSTLYSYPTNGSDIPYMLN
jgi:glutathione reductase (NADPH)